MKYFNKKNLKEVINFGKMPMANNFLKNKKKKIYTYNLKLGFNKKFKLAQIYDFPRPSSMFNENYAFISSTSKFMKKHLIYINHYMINLKMKWNQMKMLDYIFQILKLK